MTNPAEPDLATRAAAILKNNDLGTWTRPAPRLYPHQWLWDSCFVAIGLAHTDPARAAAELTSLLRGQWSNGMLPHMIFSQHFPYRFEAWLWRAYQYSPKGVTTSGITQPPVLAQAAEKVAAALAPAERATFMAAVVPGLIRYHEWLYRERDPRDTGLVACIHPWESGMDDTPSWTEALKVLPRSPWLWRLQPEFLITNPAERARPLDVQRMVVLARLIKKHHYNSREILARSPVAIQDLTFNAILAAANESLERLVQSSGQSLSPELSRHIAATRQALETLWDDASSRYLSRNIRTGQLTPQVSVGTFMPLYAGTASPEHAEALRRLLVSEGFDTPYALPSVPSNSPDFEAQRYWRGPVWVNMNWFVIAGLERYGFMVEAKKLREQTLGLVRRSGFREYYNPETGAGLGGRDFSWTAALVMDMLAS